MLDRTIEIAGDVQDVWWLYWEILKPSSPPDQGIPITHIESALRMAGWMDDWPRYLYLIQQMDAEYHTVKAEQRDVKRGRKNG